MALVKRHLVLKYITDRPGQVLHKRDIAADLDLTDVQVAQFVRAIQNESPIGRDVVTEVHGNAWRYVPSPTNPPVTASANGRPTSNPNLNRPLTVLLREYILSRPRTVVQLEELIEFTGRTAQQVRVGLNNVRITSPHLRDQILPVVRGQAWVYQPRDEQHAPPAVEPSTSRAPTSVRRPVATSSAVTLDGDEDDDDDGDDDAVAQLFETIGSTPDGKIIIQDSDGELYYATRIKGN